MKKAITVTMNPSIDKTITIDKLIPYGLNRVKSSRLDPGGKGINVAKVLESFKVDTLISGLIAGEQGKTLKGFLQQSGMNFSFLEIAGDTRTNIKLVDVSENKTTEINENGFSVSPQSLEQYKEMFRAQLEDVSLAVLAGSLPPGIPADFYAECIEIAKSNGVLTILDADGEPLKAGIKAVPYAVKPNIHELEAITGRRFQSKNEVLAAAKELLAAGIEIVIVSMGADGAIVADKNEAFAVESWDADIKSTVGAGDSMVGSLAYAILSGKSLYDIAKITTAAGTVTASKEGTQICTMSEVIESLDKVTVKIL
jgi:1-phosphofructokinase